MHARPIFVLQFYLVINVSNLITLFGVREATLFEVDGTSHLFSTIILLDVQADSKSALMRFRLFNGKFRRTFFHVIGDKDRIIMIVWFLLPTSGRKVAYKCV